MPMLTSYDAECCVCRGIKKVIIEEKLEIQGSIVTNIRSEHWGYVPSENERIVEGFCPECGVKFIYPFY